MSASVNMKENIVAKLGAIIPEPLAIPAILTSFISRVLLLHRLTFGLVSVVMIADATFSQTKFVLILFLNLTN